MRPGPALFIASLAGCAHAQLTESWERLLPTGGNHLGLHGRSAVLADGSIVIAGTRTSPLPGVASDVTLARYASNGSVLWSRTFSPTLATDTARDLSVDPASGDLLLAGVTRAVGSGDDDLRLSRFDAQGTLWWTVTHQAFHRSPASFCTPATMGTSNGLEITWAP